MAYYAFFGTGYGKAIRVGTLLVCSAIVVEDAPPLSVALFICAAFISFRAVNNHIWTWWRAIYGPTPRQIIRSYNKQWQSVKNGPVQKVVKVPPSPPTP
jgi:hypothetical protein